MISTTPRTLARCANPLNCASTVDHPASGKTGPLPFAQTPDAVRRAVAEALVSLPRTRIAVATNTYFRAESRSRVFRFVDDVEVLIDAEHRLIHLRSAARLGRRDFGVNGRRVARLRNEIRRRLEAPAPDSMTQR